MAKYNLDGKRVFITGGSSGIGLQTARDMAALGAHLVLFARNPDKLERARQEVKACSKHPDQGVETASLDVTDPKRTLSVIAQVIQKTGAPHVLIANAGVGHGDYFENIDYETFDRVFQTNVYGVRNVIAAALPFMKGRGGRIVIVSSLGGLATIPGYTAYGTSKFALVGLAHSLRAELRPLGLSVLLICPPEVTTPLVDDEAATLPKEAKTLKLMAGRLTVRDVSRDIVDAVRSGRYLTIPGFQAKMSYAMTRYLPGPWVRAFMDALFLRSRG